MRSSACVAVWFGESHTFRRDVVVVVFVFEDKPKYETNERKYSMVFCKVKNSTVTDGAY
jgi:hypothetical protein